MPQPNACPNCGFIPPADARFCPVCGAECKPVLNEEIPFRHQQDIRNDLHPEDRSVLNEEIPSLNACPHCGRPVQSGWPRCPNCGQPLKSRRAPNRLWAVLAAAGAILILAGIWFFRPAFLRPLLDRLAAGQGPVALAPPPSSTPADTPTSRPAFTSSPTSKPALTHTPRPTVTATALPSPTATITRTAVPLMGGRLPVGGINSGDTPPTGAPPGPLPPARVTQPAPPTGAASQPASPGLPDQAGLCVSYYDAGNGDLRFSCRNTYGLWNSPAPAAIDTAGDTGLYTSLGFDSRRQPWISYYDKTNGDLKVITLKNGGWVSEIVDRDGDTGLFTSLKIDQNDRVFIAYYHHDRHMLRLAQSGPDGWILQDIEDIGEIQDNGRISLALGSGGMPGVAYRSRKENNLKFARLVNGIVEIEIVDATPTTGLYCSLAFYPDGNPGISYYDMRSESLKFAFKANGTWQFSWVDQRIKKGEYSSLVITADGLPNIAYFDEENDDLLFVRWAGTSWVYPQQVDGYMHTGSYASLALDAKGRAAIAYYYITGHSLRVAARVDNQWLPVNVDNTWNTGLYPSLRFR